MDPWGNFGFNFVNLTPLAVCLPHQDGDGDGMPNGYELLHFTNAAAGVSGNDDDGDGFDNLDESKLNTNPHDPDSGLLLSQVFMTGDYPVVSWKTVGGESYMIEFSDDLTVGMFQPVITLPENDVPIGVETTESWMDDYMLTGGGPSNGVWTYRVLLVE